MLKLFDPLEMVEAVQEFQAQRDGVISWRLKNKWANDLLQEMILDPRKKCLTTYCGDTVILADRFCGSIRIRTCRVELVELYNGNGRCHYSRGQTTEREDSSGVDE